MTYPDFNKKFVVSTDASIKGLGATLSQRGENGERVIAYASRSLNQHERNYGITKLEALGVMWAIELWKVYLQDHQFDLITDHKEMKDTNPTLERWSIKISKYDFEIFHREGKKHENVDCLSRDFNNITTDEMADWQREDKDLKFLYERIMKEGIITYKAEARDILERAENPEEGAEDILERELKRGTNESDVIKEDGRMYMRTYLGGKRDRLYIPEKARRETLQQAHDHHHYETKKTYEELKEKVWWQGMYKDTELYCKSCLKCGARNSPKGVTKGIIKMMDVERKGELIGIDLLTPGPRSARGMEHVLVVTEYATKYALAFPIPDKKATTVADALWDGWITIFGVPERIISDNGGEFTVKICVRP
jgi:hypothetical protein